jgi:transitional endoplasmic reticulum ATPase
VGYSNADLEAVALLAHDMAEHQSGPVTPELLSRAIEDYMPSRDTEMIEYMELLAVFEASRRSMLPAKYREMTVDQLRQRLLTLRHSLRL